MNHDRFSALRFPNFRAFFFARIGITASHQMLATALGQAVWERTHQPMLLAWIGFTLFLPRMLLTLPAGHVADRVHRVQFILWSRVLQSLVALGFVYHAWSGFAPIGWIFPLLAMSAALTAFDAPITGALIPALINEDAFHNAMTWGSFGTQSAYMLGPLAAGFFYAWSGGVLLPLCGVLALRVLSALAMLRVRVPRALAHPTHATQGSSLGDVRWRDLLAGVRFVWIDRVLLGIFSLDLFAVLFGGVVGILPMFANDILHVGASGLGVLRAAPSVGALATALVLTNHRGFTHPGRVLIIVVAIFGSSIILFGCSRMVWISVVALIIAGVADMISVITREVLTQRRTPEHLRGRVNAVKFIFIGASNELGEFESGITARWFGAAPATILGGVITVSVVAAARFIFPALWRQRGYVDKTRVEEDPLRNS